MQKILSGFFTYLALGHIHKPQAMVRKSPGIPELWTSDQSITGDHGYIGEAMTMAECVQRICSFCIQAIKNLLLTLDETSTQYSLEEMLKEDPETGQKKYLQTDSQEDWRS